MSNQNILIVEDDVNMGMLLSEFLESKNFNVKLCRNGTLGLASFKKHKFDI